MQACELQETKGQLELTQRELRQARAANDELRLKHSNLERIERTTSVELLEERRKNDELSKQVKAMSQNLMSICSSMEAGKASRGGQEVSGLQKRCFKLVQQNTALTVQSRLLRRQKGWAEAKARVLQKEVTSVYLGTHDRVKDASELEAATEREFVAGSTGGEEAQICTLLLPLDYTHKEAVIDFLTHITHTNGRDVHGFLQSSRVFSEAIRTECLNGLGREFYAHWRLNRQLPQVLRAAERLVNLSDHLEAFEAFGHEAAALLLCGHARIWVVDHFRQSIWTCFRDGDSERTLTLPLPKSRDAADLEGRGLAATAYAFQKPVHLSDAGSDPRFSDVADAVSNRRPRSVLCVPLRREGKVRAVLQAADKLRAPLFDIEDDARVMRLLGRVSLEVLRVCEISGAASVNTKRKDNLLQLFNDCAPCDGPITLLQAVERGLQELFQSQAVALHIVTGRSLAPERRSTARLQVDGNRRKVVRVQSDGLHGVVGYVARTMNQFSLSATQVEGSPYEPSVDLHVAERTVVHTVPICEGSGCIAVVQFVCPERERTMITDDGTYHPENTSHFKMLTILLTFIQKHLHVVDQRAHGFKDTTEVTAQSPVATLEVPEDHGQASHRRRQSSKDPSEVARSEAASHRRTVSSSAVEKAMERLGRGSKNASGHDETRQAVGERRSGGSNRLGLPVEHPEGPPSAKEGSGTVERTEEPAPLTTEPA